MKHDKSPGSGWRLAWFVLGLYAVVGAIGGSHLCAVLAMVCGFMAGRAPNTGSGAT